MKLLKPVDFRAYQWRAFWFGARRRAFALFMDMGLGKTIIILSLIVFRLRKKLIEKPVLVVAPIRVIYGVWAQEAMLWAHTRGLRFSLIHGSIKQRMAALNVPADIYLVNPHGLRWLLELFHHREAMENWPFSWLIIDESSAFKAAGTKRFKKLRFLVHLFKYRTILTGTPTPNSLLELWPQFFLLDLGARLGTAFDRFKQRFFFPINHDNYSQYVPRRGSMRYMMGLISDITLRMDAADWKELPPTVYNDVWVHLPEEARARYDELEQEMFLAMDEGDVESVNAAVLTAHCWQLANGAIYTVSRRTGQKIWEPVHDAKIEALQEIVGETGSPVLIAYWFKHDLARLQALYPRAPILGTKRPQDTDKLVNAWNDGKYPIMLAHYQSAAHGLQLHKGPGHTIACYSMTWSRELYDQLIARIGGARAQQKVMVHHLLARRTTDVAMLRNITNKGITQRDALNCLKEYRREIQKRRR